MGAIRKETTTELLEIYGMNYTTLGVNVPHLLGKVLDLPAKDVRFVRYLHRTKPNLVMSVNSPYAAQACAAVSVPHIAFCDTETATAILSLTYPFSDAFITPESFVGDLGSRHLRYKGYKELAYLHPRWFTPDPGVLDLIGASTRDRLILVRFASWDSSHDLDGRALRDGSWDRLTRIIRTLEAFGRVIVTSERDLPPSLLGYMTPIPLNKIHDLLYYCTLYFGEGATMASEAGVLGTPWVFVAPSGRGYLDDQQRRYGLGYWEKTDEAALERAIELLKSPDLKPRWRARRSRLLADMTDVTDFIVNLAEQWPYYPTHARVRSQAILRLNGVTLGDRGLEKK